MTNDRLPEKNQLLDVSDEERGPFGFYVAVTCEPQIWALLEPELHKQKDYEGVEKRRRCWHVYGVDRAAARRLMKFIRNFSPHDQENAS